MNGKKKIVIPSEEEIAELTGEPRTAETAPDKAFGENAPGEDAPDASPEVNAWREKYLRARAELQNYQKRSEKDRTDSIRYANAGLVKALLPVLDDLERVVSSGTEHTADGTAIRDGVRITLDNFTKALRDVGVVPIEAEGQVFDPEVHEALMEQPSPEHDDRRVLQEVARGYRLLDRVIRPAKVIVSRPVEEQ
jgi:molecular chaperone GrpE